MADPVLATDATTQQSAGGSITQTNAALWTEKNAPKKFRRLKKPKDVQMQHKFANKALDHLQALLE